MNRKSLFAGLFPLLLGASYTTEYRKRHTCKVRFNPYFRWRDKDRDRTLVPFHVHGEVVMAYSRKDAIKRWVHMDLKNRRRR